MTYITSFSGSLQGVPSNCAMTALCRLAAQYVSEREYPEAIRKMLAEYGRVVSSDPSRAILFRPIDDIRTSVAKIQQVSAMFERSPFPFPLEFGFGKLLVDIIERSPAILFLSDVQDGGMDGHTGEFHTGAFAEWALRTGAMHGNQTTGRKQREGKSYEIYAWNLVLDAGRSRNLVNDLNEQAVRYIADVLDGSAIQEAINEAEQARKNQQAVLTTSFDNWLTATNVDQTVPPTPPEAAQGPPETNTEAGDVPLAPPVHEGIQRAMQWAQRQAVVGAGVRRGDVFMDRNGAQIQYMGGSWGNPGNWIINPPRRTTSARVRAPRPFPPLLRRR